MRIVKGAYEYNYFDDDDRTIMIRISKIPEGWKKILRPDAKVNRLVALTVASAFVGILISGALAALSP